ncbi:MAG TPA: SMP-30/gluconolactonase/LRE family protein [Mycobacteriales bacterium]|jgi:sugar lactone lactonase YvrE|nr:SMP-30/gluconolactonase/LRE family protein [Mycobacteriales bacterium]
MAADVRRLAADLALDIRNDLGESPRWDPVSAELLWVDITPGTLLRASVVPSSAGPIVLGAPRVTALGGSLSAISPRAGGGLIAALGGGVSLIDPDGSVHPIATLRGTGPWRLNDGSADPRGSFWIGSVNLALAQRCCSLWRVDPDRSVHEMVTEVGVSNGLGWSPDGRTMYYIDTMRLSVFAYDFDLESGALTGRRRLYRAGDGDGYPDGLAVDADGMVWVALHGAGQVRCLDPAGTLRAVVEVPVEDVTACCFGGADLGTLFITTSRALAKGEPDEHAGGVYACRPGSVGLPPHSFAG